MNANSTLVADCAVVDAKLQLEAQCADMARLTALRDLVNNATKLNELETYRQLAVRASQCGYRINKVVYRGYGAPHPVCGSSLQVERLA